MASVNAQLQGTAGVSYKDAGVDIDAGEELVRRIGPACKATARSGCALCPKRAYLLGVGACSRSHVRAISIMRRAGGPRAFACHWLRGATCRFDVDDAQAACQG